MNSTDAIPATGELLDAAKATIAPVVVASDGSEYSEPALRLAQRLAQHAGGMVYVVAIHEIPLALGLLATPALVEAHEGWREAFRRQVASQVRRIAGPENSGWSLIVRDGDPATELARIAAELSARMLVIGVRHRHFTDRLFGRETALRLLQRCRVPLLIVPGAFSHLPRCALVATDLSASSLEAGRTALRLLDTISRVSLLHVTPSPASARMYATWREWLDEDPTGALERMKSDLAIAPSITVEIESREGDAAHEIVSVARHKAVDLIVTASRGAGLLDRLLVGSTARGVVHSADCAVLVVQPSRGDG